MLAVCQLLAHCSRAVVDVLPQTPQEYAAACVQLFDEISCARADAPTVEEVRELLLRADGLWHFGIRNAESELIVQNAARMAIIQAYKLTLIDFMQLVCKLVRPYSCSRHFETGSDSK